jgi:hypothetical protein
MKKITVFTSNQPRHINLIKSLASIADEVFVVQECTTIFPGMVNDFFHKSEIMQNYFSHVQEAEREVFGPVDFLPKNVKSLCIKMGDLNKTPMKYLKNALESDHYVVFGSSYIKGELCDFLVQNNCFNIHMGISPHYRGNSCNFWALYDKKPDFVGASILLLSKGLDSGKILFHALPKVSAYKPFTLGMQSVKSAHDALVQELDSGRIFHTKAMVQDVSRELRYTRKIEFTDKIAKDFLENHLKENKILEILESRDLSQFINPIIK